MDDGGGVFVSLESLRLLKHLELIPRRNLRVALWTAEEVGLIGAEQYVNGKTEAEINEYVAVFESDIGTFLPLGLDFHGSNAASCVMTEILKLLASINATELMIMENPVSTDISFFQEAPYNIPGMELRNNPDCYFWYHHTEADTMSLIDSNELDLGLVTMAAASFIVADLNFVLPKSDTDEPDWTQPIPAEINESFDNNYIMDSAVNDLTKTRPTCDFNDQTMLFYKERSETKNEYNCAGLSQDIINEIAGYKEAADRIIEAATNGVWKGRTYKDLEAFVDKFGTRMTGYQSLEDSITYMEEQMKTVYQLDEVIEDPVTVPVWKRGEEWAKVKILNGNTEIRERNLELLGLGTTIATLNSTGQVVPITAEALVFNSFEEMESNSNEMINGKIVVFNQGYIGYGPTNVYRTNGAARAARKGAIAVLIQSIAPYGLNTPHTGHQEYANGVTKIPTACITIEDAQLLRRLQEDGFKLEIQLFMDDHNEEDADSRNLIGVLEGTEIKDKIVLLSGHVDSWDVGQGAMDDGGGVFISVLALAMLKQLNLVPKRTMHAVLWTAEEVGLIGAEQFVKKALTREGQLRNYVAVMESDAGTFKPLGIDFAGTDNAGCIIKEILKLLVPIGANQYEKSARVSTDITHFQDHGVPGLSLRNEPNCYFWFHHTESDTMSMMDSEELDLGLAEWTVVSYVLANMTGELPRTYKSAGIANFQNLNVITHIFLLIASSIIARRLLR